MKSTLMVIPSISSSEIEVAREVIVDVEKIESQARNIATVQSDAECQVANTIVSSAHEMSKMLEKMRKDAKAPFIEIGRKLDGATMPLITRMDTVKASLSAMLLSYQRELQRKADELRRRQEQEQREAERAAQAKARQEEIERRKKNLPIAPVQIQPVQQVPQVSIEVPKLAVHTRKIPTLVIDNPDIVPIMVRTQEGNICIRPIDETTVKSLLSANISIPGCRIEQKEIAATR